MKAFAQAAYEADFALWAEQQAAAIDAGEWQTVDAANVAEEIASLGRSDNNAVLSCLQRLLEHVLKLRAMPTDLAARGWEASVDKQATKLHDLLAASPSLRNHLGASFDLALRRANRRVIRDCPDLAPYAGNLGGLRAQILAIIEAA